MTRQEQSFNLSAERRNKSTAVMPSKLGAASAGFECMAAVDILRAGERQLQAVLTMFLAHSELEGLASKLRPIIRVAQKIIHEQGGMTE